MPRRLKPAPVAVPDSPSLSPELAALIGVYDLADTSDRTPPAEGSMLDWALHYAERTIYVFPARRFLGSPLIPKWHDHASVTTGTIIEWWSSWPNADICAAPDQSGHYVIAAFQDEGGPGSLAELEAEHGELPADFRYQDRWGDVYLWMDGNAYTSHHKLGRGVHVLGVGQRVFLPPSWAPHIVYGNR